MKTRILSILALLLMTASGAWADTTVTWTASDMETPGIHIDFWDGEANNNTIKGITVTSSGGGGAGDGWGKTDINLYGGSTTITFTSSVGNIKSIAITADEITMSSTPSEWTLSDGNTKLSWSGVASSTVSLPLSGGTGIYNISGIVFTIESSTVNVTAKEGASGEYWSTFYSASQGYTADASTTIYKGKLNGSSLTLTEVTDIAAGQAVILKSTTGAITLTPAATTSSDFTGNDLKGGTTVATGNDAYTLSRGSAGTGAVGFYKFSGATLDGSKAHLEIPTSAARSFIGFGDGTTAIELPALADDEAAEWYSLDGRRLSGKPARKGIYVRNGQKIIIK